jgi:hypothetical protein
MTTEFNIGDKIILIDNIDKENNIPFNNITVNKQYTVIKKSYEDMVGIINDEGNHRFFKSYRFITLKESRKQKLDKINQVR